MLELEQRKLIGGTVIDVEVTVDYYPPQWGTPQAIPYTFTCMGYIFLKDKVTPTLRVQGALVDKDLPDKRPRHHIVEPLRQALEAKLEVPVVPFQPNIIEDR